MTTYEGAVGCVGPLHGESEKLDLGNGEARAKPKMVGPNYCDPPASNCYKLEDFVSATGLDGVGATDLAGEGAIYAKLGDEATTNFGSGRKEKSDVLLVGPETAGPLPYGIPVEHTITFVENIVFKLVHPIREEVGASLSLVSIVHRVPPIRGKS